MRAPGRTLRARIVWTTAIVSAIAMTAMIGTVLLVLSALESNNIDARLHDQIAAISTTLSVGPDGAVRAAETPDDTIDDTTWIYRINGDLVEGPERGERVQSVARQLSDVAKETRIRRGDRVFLARPVVHKGQKIAVVVVTASLDPYEATRTIIIAGLIAVGAAVTAGSAALAAWAVRRTLIPVESMAERAEDWSEHDLDARFDDTGTEDEFAVLGRTLNLLLDRVAGALRNEQQLTAELAHELRTPLTAIRGEAELAIMGQPDPASAERFNRVVALSDRMSTTISSLLAIARGSAGSAARTTVSALVTSALDERPPHPDVTVSVDHVTDDEISAPIDLALRALSPLVDNAFRHARSAVTFTVAVEVRTVGITVSDDGEGVSQTDSESLFTSGQRDPTSDGAGLGLALSRRVARSLGGDVDLTSAVAPTSFTLTLPRF
jgi:two-component system OmpR family sensor kinase